MAEAPLLEVENITTRYGLSQVLFGMTLTIAAGEMVTLMGRNGMGKTTTVRSIMGLTPATAGSIRFAISGSLQRIIPPRGPRSVLCVVVVTIWACGKGLGWTPAAISPAMCAMSASR